MPFSDSIQAYSPPWLADDSPQSTTNPTGGVGGRFMFVLGLMVDVNLEKLDQAMRAHMPGQGTNTALPLLGDDRLIVRGLTETDASYAGRLSLSFDSWRFAGGDRGVLSNVLGYLLGAEPGGATLQINPVASNIWVTWRWYEAGQNIGGAPEYSLVSQAATTIALPNDPYAPFQLARQFARWRWWLFVNQGSGANAWFTPAPVIGTPGQVFGAAGGAIGSAGPPSVGDDLRRIVNLWKQAGSWCREIILSAVDANPSAGVPRVDWSTVSFSGTAIEYIRDSNTNTSSRYVAGIANYGNSYGGWQGLYLGVAAHANDTTPTLSFGYTAAGISLATYAQASPAQVAVLTPGQGALGWTATAPGTGPLY